MIHNWDLLLRFFTEILLDFNESLQAYTARGWRIDDKPASLLTALSKHCESSCADSNYRRVLAVEPMLTLTSLFRNLRHFEAFCCFSKVYKCKMKIFSCWQFARKALSSSLKRNLFSFGKMAKPSKTSNQVISLWKLSDQKFGEYLPNAFANKPSNRRFRIPNF